jgi:hypothetical protein
MPCAGRSATSTRRTTFPSPLRFWLATAARETLEVVDKFIPRSPRPFFVEPHNEGREESLIRDPLLCRLRWTIENGQVA